MLMSYVVDKFPEIHSPTIYDKFSSELPVQMLHENFFSVCIVNVSFIALFYNDIPLFPPLQLLSESMEEEYQSPCATLQARYVQTSS